MQALYAKKMFFMKDFRFNHAFVVSHEKINCLTKVLCKAYLLYQMPDSNASPN